MCTARLRETALCTKMPRCLHEIVVCTAIVIRMHLKLIKLIMIKISYQAEGPLTFIFPLHFLLSLLFCYPSLPTASRCCEIKSRQLLLFPLRPNNLSVNIPYSFSHKNKNIPLHFNIITERKTWKEARPLSLGKYIYTYLQAT